MLISRREMLRNAVAAVAALAVPVPLAGCRGAPRETDPDAVPSIGRTDQSMFDAPDPEDAARFSSWVQTLRDEGLDSSRTPLALAAARVGELAVGTPYEAFTLEAYLRAGGSPMRSEPLTLTLTRFDCVSLVESCIAVARVARTEGEPTWDRFVREMERMRYRGGVRAGYTSRLHYFSDWLGDGERRELVQDIGQRLGARPDSRPLRFMSEHPDSYPALAERSVLEEIAEIERSLDRTPRLVIPTTSIPDTDSSIQTGDILAFATSIEGLDVTHSAFAYRDSNDVLRVLHAPLSGGVVEVTRATLPQYVAGIRRSTGIIVARPLG
ncbi:MAG: DUF1460 domain-containing protein [Gemmatimonadetes bacterium]|nr:DUF1460 domain-containing protein [Gemmatimonadota bacterium]